MTNLIVCDEQELINVADAVRGKLGSIEPMSLNDMANKASSLSSPLEIVQTSGSNMMSVMSQKATTDYVFTKSLELSQTSPEFVTSVEECEDVYKPYILPDGQIYIYNQSGTTECTNLVQSSTDIDGGIYNKTGYRNEVRLNSSGGITAQQNSVTTGFMPWSSCGIIRIKGALWNSTDEGTHYYVTFYDASKAYNYYFSSRDVILSDKEPYSLISITYDETTDVTTIDTSGVAAHGSSAGVTGAVKNSVYFRLTAIGSGENLIITLNEEISASATVGAGAWTSIGYSNMFNPTKYRLPILYLTGSADGISKENAVSLSYKYEDYNGSCTLKWQGSSSLAWDKKNYTIKFDNPFEVVDGWGSQNKYCLKANWIDHSHSRNVVSAKLWGRVRKTGIDIPSGLKSLPNAGAIDGFPVIIMFNGKFHGLYSFNIPKEAWLFGMGSGDSEAIVGADNQAEDTAFKAETLLNADGWELEYSSDSFSDSDVKNSLNNLIRACINSDGQDLDTVVAQYVDWESAIDYYIFAAVIKGGDMITKNTLLVTFDGVKWYFSAYDMDTTYGLEFDGSCLTRAVSNTSFEEIAAAHRVFELIKCFKPGALKARYKQLRADALSETRICQYFENYLWDVSSSILAEDVKCWPSVRGSSVNGIDQICRWVRQRLEICDSWIESLPEQTPSEPVVKVNLVTTSTDTDGSIYNGVGYNDNIRLSSSGGISSSPQEGSAVTGFMSCAPTDVIKMRGAEWVGMSTAHSGHHFYINFYASDKTFIEGIASSSYDGGSYGAGITYDADTNTTTFDLTNLSNSFMNTLKTKNAAYFRINAYGRGEDLVITID